MNRTVLAHLIQTTLANTGTTVSKATSSIVLDKILSYITDSVASGEKISLSGFGAFTPSERKATVKSNPHRPGEMLNIAGYKCVKFRPFKEFKESVRKG